MHRGHLCVVFELLSHSLLDLLNFTLLADPNVPGLSLRMVRLSRLYNGAATHLIGPQALSPATLSTCGVEGAQAHPLRYQSIYSFVVIYDVWLTKQPENVALTSSHKAHVKIIDFGSACHSYEKVCNVWTSASNQALSISSFADY